MRSTFGNWYETKMYATPELSKETSEIGKLLEEVHTIAIVGISTNQNRESHFVGRYMKNAGYTIIPVNPGADSILDEKCYPDLASIPFPVDVVDIFRKRKDIAGVVDEAIALQPVIIWLQLGTGTHDDLIGKTKERGIRLVQNRCIKVDHQFLIRPKQEKNKQRNVTHEQ
jgi:uncharacterized protein